MDKDVLFAAMSDVSARLKADNTSLQIDTFQISTENILGLPTLDVRLDKESSPLLSMYFNPLSIKVIWGGSVRYEISYSDPDYYEKLKSSVLELFQDV